MVNQQMLEGSWNELKGKIREKWGQLTDSDLPQFRGNMDQLVGTIQRKTGEGRDAIEHYLQDITEGAGSFVGKTADRLRQYAQQTAESVQGTAQQVLEQARSSYSGAQDLVRGRPTESLAVVFGVGVTVGVLVALMLRSR
jgi:uncharacterized protein YjbJ (UPF0337 family)